MKIVIMVEGKTEVAFKDSLRKFLEKHLAGRMPQLNLAPYDGRIPKQDKLRRAVAAHLGGAKPADAVIALTDVYTGTSDFTDAADARQKMRQWAGEDTRFYPHAAQHDFEAWLLPFWNTIQQLAGHKKNAPPGRPEDVDHDRPPSTRIREVFEAGKCRDSYSKPRDAKRILSENDLAVSVAACPELKAFVNTILSLCGGDPVA